MSNSGNFQMAFKVLTGYEPFPWQEELYEKWFKESKIPASCNLPTGFGKTSILAVWLISLAHGANLPRRLVYVVNRRTVVDQTTNEAIRLRKNAVKIGMQDLAISTLRGQYADNRDWSVDPSRPAIVCGTVDMIGSRLLFSGYGLSIKSRPLHAGFLGQDTLIVHDEAHLEPAFQSLLQCIDQEQKKGRCVDFRPLRIMELTATSRNINSDENTLYLTDRDLRNPIIDQRFNSRKSLFLHAVDSEKQVAERVFKMAARYERKNAAVLVYVRTPDQVLTICDRLRTEGVDEYRIQRLTGTMRGWERDRMIDPRKESGCPVFARFLKTPGPNAEENERWKIQPKQGTVYLVCTSAGEVGIDISADHMVCDLTTFESMCQRLGRVNRFGSGNANIDVVHPRVFEAKEKLSLAREKTYELLKNLPKRTVQRNGENGISYDASPAALTKLSQGTGLPCKIHEAFSPEPGILSPTDVLFDAWSLTTIRDKMPGRPPVAPYLHGVAEWDPPETGIAWRQEVEILSEDADGKYDPADLLEDYPIKPHELLKERSNRVFAFLQQLAQMHPNTKTWFVDSQNAVTALTLEDILEKREGESFLGGGTLLLPPSVGGLSRSGTLLPGAGKSETTVTYDVADELMDCGIPLRKRVVGEMEDPEGMTLVREILLDDSEDEEADPTVWRWYVRKPEVPNERGRIAVVLESHSSQVKSNARQMVEKLGLPPDISKAVVIAAELHDQGKSREQWQHSIGNYLFPIQIFAKSGYLHDGRRIRANPFNNISRHEFASLVDIEKNADFCDQPEEMKDLIRHLIAAHHGYARPHFSLDDAYDSTISSDEASGIAADIPRRFGMLQRRFGRWGLAYLESLVRAADWAASAHPVDIKNELEVER